MSGPLFALTLVAAVGCAAVGGVFFGFSAFVMKGLGRLPAAQGVAAMQSVNVTAVTPPFMAGLFGTAALCLGLGVTAIAARHTPYAGFLLAGALLYLVGVVGLTAAYHVPRNDALAAVGPDTPAAAALWAVYRVSWTRWNHLRAATGVASAACFALALTR